MNHAQFLKEQVRLLSTPFKPPTDTLTLPSPILTMSLRKVNDNLSRQCSVSYGVKSQNAVVKGLHILEQQGNSNSNSSSSSSSSSDGNFSDSDISSDEFSSDDDNHSSDNVNSSGRINSSGNNAQLRPRRSSGSNTQQNRANRSRSSGRNVNEGSQSTAVLEKLRSIAALEKGIEGALAYREQLLRLQSLASKVDLTNMCVTQKDVNNATAVNQICDRIYMKLKSNPSLLQRLKQNKMNFQSVQCLLTENREWVDNSAGSHSTQLMRRIIACFTDHTEDQKSQQSPPKSQSQSQQSPPLSQSQSQSTSVSISKSNSQSQLKPQRQSQSQTPTQTQTKTQSRSLIKNELVRGGNFRPSRKRKGKAISNRKNPHKRKKYQ